MKILALNNRSNLVGGSEAVFHDSAELLRGAGHQVLNVTAYGHQSTSAKNEICFEKSGLRRQVLSVVDPFVGKKLRRLIADFSPDIIHVHIFHGGLTYSIVRELQKSGVPHLMTVHEYKLLCPVFTMGNRDNQICDLCSGGSYYHALTKRCKRNSLVWSAHSALDSYVRKFFYDDLNTFDRYIFVSKFSMELHLKYRPNLGARSSHIYNPIPASEPGRKYSAAARNGFLYVGRLSHEKGLMTLIRAVSRKSDITLTLVGDGPFRSDIERAIDELRVRDRVHVMGFVDRHKLPSIMGAHRFMVIPSEWYENNPMSLLESMSAGLPAIGSAIGGIPELVQNDYTGRLFEPFNVDSLTSALDWAQNVDDEQWKNLSNNSIEYVETHMGRDRYRTELLTLYENLNSTEQ